MLLFVLLLLLLLFYVVVALLAAVAVAAVAAIVIIFKDIVMNKDNPKPKLLWELAHTVFGIRYFIYVFKLW